MKKIACYHWRSDCESLNFGEALIPLIVGYFGYEYVPSHHGPADKPVLLSIGSELYRDYVNTAKRGHEKVVVWGQGHARGDIAGIDADIRGVRGYQTRDTLGADSFLPVGDPGFLLPMIHPVVHESQDYLLHAPHWHARRFGYVADSFNLEIINGDLLTAKIERLVYAKFVYTSSLHVAITCIAYGVPFGLFLNRQEKANLTAKWRDVWSTLVHREGRHPGQPKFFHSLHQCRDWWVDEGCYLLPPSMDQMVAAFPHDIAY